PRRGRGRFGFTKHCLEGSRHPLGGGPGLAGDPAPPDVDEHVQPVPHVEQGQRTGHGRPVLVLGEELLQRPFVDHDLAGPPGDPDAAHGRFSPPRAQVEFLLRAHVRRLPYVSLNSFGFWAWCGCCDPAYIFSLASWARPSRLRGTIRLTAWYRISS